MNGIIFYNQQFLPANMPCIMAHDRGLTLGDGVFETILSYDYKMPFFEQHWQRLIASLYLLAIKLPDKYNKNYVIGIINKLLDKNNVKTKAWQGIKIIVTRGIGPRSLEPKTDYYYAASLLITCFDTTAPQLGAKSLHLDFNNKVNQYSPLPNIKSLNYLDKIIAKQLALDAGYDDALLINIDSNICEATTSNIFLVLDDDKVITPKITDGVLPGITRAVALDNLKKLNFKVYEISININEITQNKYSISAAFITNAVIGIHEVSEINNLDLTLGTHPIIELLYRKFLGLFSLSSRGEDRGIH